MNRRYNLGCNAGEEGAATNMAPPRVGAQRVVWSLAALVFMGLAVGAPVQMVRAQRARASASTGADAGSVKVSMVALSFRPADLAVRKGTEVVFENDDVTVHTVNGANGGPVDSGSLAPRKVYKVVINEVLDYVCLIHPSMRGKIILTG